MAFFLVNVFFTLNMFYCIQGLLQFQRNLQDEIVTVKSSADVQIWKFHKYQIN